jgi:hypothetical protein
MTSVVPLRAPDFPALAAAFRFFKYLEQKLFRRARHWLSSGYNPSKLVKKAGEPWKMESAG